MGFFVDTPLPRSKTEKLSLAFLHEAQCRVCTLRNAPKVEPDGAMPAEVYILGEAGGAEEARQGVPFVGPSGHLLRRHLPNGWIDRIRFNNTVLSHPPNNRVPTQLELECCRPYVAEDIQLAQPRAIIGLGNTALHWLTGEPNILRWAGRHLPVKVGEHVCWYFPLVHPASVLRTSDREREDAEFTFDIQLHHAFDLIEQLPAPVVHSREDAEAEIEVLCNYDNADFRKICDFLQEATEYAGVSGVDFETNNNLRPYAEDARIVTVAVSLPGRTIAFPYRHSQARWATKHELAIGRMLVQYLSQARGRKAAHNAAFEAEWAYHLSDNDPATVRAEHWDCTQSMAFILDPRTQIGALDLGFTTQQFFGLNIKSLSTIDRKRLDHTDPEIVCRYNGIDAKYHRLLCDPLLTRLNSEGQEPQYVHNLERVLAITKTQAMGLLIDKEANTELSVEYTGRVKATAAKINKLKVAQAFHTQRGVPFNPGSNKDILYALTNMLKLDVANTNEASLEQLDHPLARLILDYRHDAKVLSTYLKPLTTPVSKGGLVYPDGRLHHIIGTMSTRTWRTNGEDPNTQNFTKHDKDGVRVRRQIIASPGKVLIAVDFSGIQARNVAMESRDEALVQAFFDHYDIHGDWRDRILEYYPEWADRYPPSDDLHKVLRQESKNKWVFPMFFGSASYSAAQALGIPDEIGAQLQDDFFAAFPGIHTWQTGLKRFYRRKGYVTGLSGFRRYAPVSPNVIINTPIQSDESMIVLGAMIRLAAYEDPNLQPVLEVHDDLTFEVDAKKVDHYLDIIVGEMLKIEYDWINVPLACEASVGADWLNLKRIGEYESNETGYEELKK